jgi:hypothetical protein
MGCRVMVTFVVPPAQSILSVILMSESPCAPRGRCAHGWQRALPHFYLPFGGDFSVIFYHVRPGGVGRLATVQALGCLPGP